MSGPEPADPARRPEVEWVEVRGRVGLGLLALLFYAVHAGYFLSVGRPSNLLWGCHMASLGVGTGYLFRSPVLNGMGVIALMWGMPMWLLDVSTGGEFLPTSLGTHVGGLSLGFYGIWRWGLPRWSWLRVVLFTLGLMVIGRWITVPAENVNLAFGPPKGWEQTLPPMPTFLGIVLAGSSGFFCCWEVALRRLLRLLRRCPSPPDGTIETS